MGSTIINDLTKTIATSGLEVPTAIAKTNDFHSLQNNAAASEPIANTSSYALVDWTRLKGYTIPSDDADIESGI